MLRLSSPANQRVCGTKSAFSSFTSGTQIGSFLVHLSFTHDCATYSSCLGCMRALGKGWRLSRLTGPSNTPRPNWLGGCQASASSAGRSFLTRPASHLPLCIGRLLGRGDFFVHRWTGDYHREHASMRRCRRSVGHLWMTMGNRHRRPSRGWLE